MAAKRKLNRDNVPEEQREDALPQEAIAPASDGEPAAPDSDVAASVVQFTDLGLDPRLLQAIVKEKYAAPTPVQAAAIPLALKGIDVLARARTGSGKTAAYVLPILQSILKQKSSSSSSRRTSALILVPTRELASQVTKAVASLSAFCTKDVQAVNLTPQIPDQAQRALLASTPDVVVSTPTPALVHLNTSALDVKQLQHLVVDEADLVSSYEYDTDLKNIVALLPKGVQTFLASATLTDEVETLRSMFCREDSRVLDLQDDDGDSGAVSQYVVKCAEDEKFLLLFALFKLRLIKGKCIIFVGDVDRCYRLRLYLEQFGIKSCVLNSELPVNCRVHVVEEFNKNVYDIIIAADEHEVIGGDENTKPVDEEKTKPVDEKKAQDAAEDAAQDGQEGAPKKKKPKKTHKSTRRDREYGISRGIDFHNVACVLNFDFPTSLRSYTHRIGRTARAGRSGIALSFVVPPDQYLKHKLLSFPTTRRDEKTLAQVEASPPDGTTAIEPYNFDMAKLEGFRYRVGSALKAVTAGTIREARIRELRAELLRSEKLKRHLEENPADASFLRHDAENRSAKLQPHLKHIPEYLLPAGASADLHNTSRGSAPVGFVALGAGGGGKRESQNRIRRARERNKLRGKAGGRTKIKKSDPLKTFNARGRGK